MNNTRPVVGESVEDAEARVDNALTRIVRALSRDSVRRTRGWGARSALSDTDVWLLGFVAEHDRARPTDLAAWQDVDKSTITMQLKRLLTLGLIERAPDEADRRATNISITPQGCAALEEVREQGRVFLQEILRDWSPQERAELARVMARLAHGVEERTRPV